MSTMNDSITRMGPGAGGALFLPAVSPHDSRFMLVSSDMSGAFVTHDGGASWKQFNLNNGVSAFAFDSGNPGVAYAGSTGLFRSVDAGLSWSMVFPSPKAVTGCRILDDEADPELASTDNYPALGRVVSICVDSTNSGFTAIAVRSDRMEVFTTTDGGLSWEPVCPIACSKVFAMDVCSIGGEKTLAICCDSGIFLLNLKDKAVSEIPLPPGSQEIGSACIGIRDGLPVFYAVCRQGGGVWRAQGPAFAWVECGAVPDPGAEWEWDASAIQAGPVSCTHDGLTVYLGADGRGSQSFYGILKSRDEGRHWGWALKGSHIADPLNRAGGWVEHHYDNSWHNIGPKGDRPLGLAAAPYDPDICLYTDLGGAFATKDGGIHWHQVYCDMSRDGSAASRGLDITTCYGVHFDPFAREHIAVSYTDCGLFHSSDEGSSWKHSLTGIAPEWGNTCYWIEFDPDVPGRAWSAWAYCHDLPRAKMFRGDSLARGHGGICRTDNGLLNWRNCSRGLPEQCAAVHITLGAGSPAGRRTLYLSVFGGGVYKSEDDGYHWAERNAGIGRNRNAWRIASLPDGTLYLVVARGEEAEERMDGAVYVSADGAGSWSPVPLPEGANAPNDLMLCDGAMYLACWPRFDSGRAFAGGLYQSKDGGRNWELLFDDAAHVYSTAALPGCPQALLLSTFGRGVHRSDDGGSTWRRLAGYDFKAWHRVIPDPYDANRIYLTSFGSSVCRGPSDGGTAAGTDGVRPVQSF